MVTAYSICWLFVSQMYLSTLFNCQRTVGIDLPIKDHNSLWALIDKLINDSPCTSYPIHGDKTLI